VRARGPAPYATASRSGLALAAALATGTAASAQPVFRAALEMVNVTVTARDAKGQLVSDLRAEELIVREDGRPQRVLLFAPAAQPEGRETLALNLGMLFDTSRSMRKEAKLSHESAIRLLEAVPRAKDLLLILFDNDIRISHYASEKQQNIVERIPGRGGGSATLLYDAIALYLSRVAETPGRKVLVLFSDGDDNASRFNSAEVTSLLRASDVVVYPIAFQGERPNSMEGALARSFLASLAEMSGGRVFAPSASQQLPAIYQSILEELGSQYVLGYVPDDSARDGRFRKLAVVVNRPGVRLRYRPGYIVAKKEMPP
jgi:Ca-activated chloride channel homolog